jgi:hypothetical protein
MAAGPSRITCGFLDRPCEVDSTIGVHFTEIVTAAHGQPDRPSIPPERLLVKFQQRYEKATWVFGKGLRHQGRSVYELKAVNRV